MANRFTSGDQPDDPLALFGDESASKNGATETAQGRDTSFTRKATQERAASAPETPANIAYPTATDFTRIAASVPRSTSLDSSDLEVEVIGPRPPTGSVSFDHVCAVKGLGFVEGVALVQAAAEAVHDGGSGVPELHGLSLTRAGEVVLHGPPTGEPPARELARLLHQLVDPNLMPPAGRLFIGRWINNDAGDLREFVSELAYFARPNGQELLLAVHGRCDGVRASVTATQPPPRARRARTVARPDQAPPETKPTPQLLGWFALHKRELTIAAAVIGVAATLTAAATLLWAPGTVEASKALPPINSLSEVDSAQAGPPARTSSKRPASTATSSKNGGGASNEASRTRPAAPPLDRRINDQVPPSAIASQDASGTIPVTPPALQARTVPDLRIYTANDPGVEPPVLRSAEIPELLIAGFEKRTNEVELVISETGEVQQARMVKAPQRMPDIMLLSRAKELLFTPATRNGVPVRYRLVLSWNVTP